MRRGATIALAATLSIGAASLDPATDARAQRFEGGAEAAAAPVSPAPSAIAPIPSPSASYGPGASPPATGDDALPARGSARTVLIAGDIASCDWSGDDRTADLIARRRGLVMTAGDNAYPAASLAVLRACYGPTWGRFKRRTVPALGNHDDIGAFFAYFGRRAGQRGRGYHAFDHGPWRVYVLDSNCTLRPGCASGTRQYRWLERDLRRNPRRCSMAVLHHPAYSSGLHGGSIRTIPLLRLLYDAGTDLVVNGHDHVYERFAPAAPWGRADDDHGIRQFIVGTGGAPLYPFREGPPSRHSQVRQNQTHGVLKLTLREDRYAWKFLAVAGGRFRDEGEAECHDPPTGRAGNRQRTPSVGGIAGRR